MKGKSKNRGFSLIELIIVIAILAVLSGLLFIGPGVFRRREIDKYTKELCGQIRQIQTISMARSGQWRLALYEDGGEYYCVQEKRQYDSAEGYFWTAQTGQIELGNAGGITYTRTAGTEPSINGEHNEFNGRPVLWWTFHKDTGACTAGTGTYSVSGVGKTQWFKVYKESGRCEEVNSGS